MEDWTHLPVPEQNWAYSDEETRGWWAGEFVIINKHGFNHHSRTYHQLVNWILQTVESPWCNACWRKINDCIYVKFKNEDDLVMALLRWNNDNLHS